MRSGSSSGSSGGVSVVLDPAAAAAASAAIGAADAANTTDAAASAAAAADTAADAAHRVETLLAHLNDAVRDLLKENRVLRAKAATATPKAFAPPNNRLVNLFTRGWTKPAVQVWAPRRHWLAHRDGVLDVDTSALDATLLCSASVDGSALLWSTATEAVAAPLLALRTHQGAVNAARFHPLKPLLLTASGDHTLAITTIRAPPAAVVSAPPSVARSQSLPVLDDGIASSSSSSSSPPPVSRTRSRSFPSLARARVVDAADAVCSAHTDAVVAAAWLGAAGDHFVSGSWDASACVWALTESGATALRFLRAHEARVLGVSAAAAGGGGQRVATASQDTTFMVWDVREPRRPTTTFPGHTGAVNAAVFVRDDHVLASSSDDRTVQMWDERAPKKPLVEIGCSSRVNRLCVAPRRGLVTLPADDGSLKTYNLSGDLVIRNARDAYTGILTCATWSRDGSELYSSGWDLSVTCWAPPAATAAAVATAAAADLLQ